MRACVRMCARVCAYVCVRVCVCMCVRACVRTRMCAFVHACMRVREVCASVFGNLCMAKNSRIWDIEDKVCTAVLEGHDGKIFSCHMSSWEIYEPLLLTCGADGEFKIWDVRKQEFRNALVGHYDTCLACSINQDGRYGVSVGQDGTVRVWNIRNLIELSITLIVGEGGTGITSAYELMVDPKDDVYSAKGQLRIVSDTPLSYNKDGEPNFHVPDPKYRGLQPDEQAWTALLQGRKKILSPDHERLDKFDVTNGCSVTVVRQMSKVRKCAWTILCACVCGRVVAWDSLSTCAHIRTHCVHADGTDSALSGGALGS